MSKFEGYEFAHLIDYEWWNINKYIQVFIIWNSKHQSRSIGDPWILWLGQIVAIWYRSFHELCDRADCDDFKIKIPTAKITQ